MNKVFPFAKIAGICMSVMLFLFVLLRITAPKADWSLFHYLSGQFIYLALYGLWITFFVLLIKGSARRSPVVPPSWIATAAYIVSICSLLVYTLNSILSIHLHEYEKIQPLATAGLILSYISAIGIAVAFFWLAKYFGKGSLLKAMAIIFATVTIIKPLSYLFMRLWGWELFNHNTYMTVYNILIWFWLLMSFIPQTIFFFAFSKLKK